MKKQLLALTALLALFATNSMVAQFLPLDPNKALEIQQIAQSLEKISAEKIGPGQIGVFTPIAADEIKLVDEKIEAASAIELKNAHIAMVIIKNRYAAATQQLENILSGVATSNSIARLTSKDVDELLPLLTRLYNGETYESIKKGKMLGWDANIVGRTLAFIADAANQLEKIHAYFKPVILLPSNGIRAHRGGVPTPTSSEKAKHFIAYAAGRLAMYNAELNQPISTQPISSPALPLYPINTLKQKAYEAAEKAGKAEEARTKVAAQRTVAQ